MYQSLSTINGGDSPKAPHEKNRLNKLDTSSQSSIHPLDLPDPGENNFIKVNTRETSSQTFDIFIVLYIYIDMYISQMLNVYGIFTYIWVVLGVNVGKYTIH